MKMNQNNLVSACKEMAVDLALLLTSYREIETDNASTREEIELLDIQFGEILDKMNDVIAFAGQARQTADMVSDSLVPGLQLTAEIMHEKTRILKTGAAPANPFSMDYHFSLN